jgi:multiple sugar transport system ATP-binding protein
MNLLEAGDVIVGFRPERFLPAGLIAPWAPLGEISKTLQPEHLLPADLESSGKRICLRFRVEHSEFLGAERILYGTLEGTRFRDKPVCARVSSSVLETYTPQTTYDFAVPEHELKFFDATSCKRIPPRPLSWQ